VLLTNMRASFCTVASARIARAIKIATTKAVFALMASAKITLSITTAKERSFAKTILIVSQSSAIDIMMEENMAWVFVITSGDGNPNALKVKVIALLFEHYFLFILYLLYYYSLSQMCAFVFFISYQQNTGALFSLFAKKNLLSVIIPEILISFLVQYFRFISFNSTGT